ncbi:hypothetical protein BDW02DRAFT_567597 [Decorospora gaudefroyi]|uniref:Autophagy-related protein 27 n=1 Tax=Decorospora gaudefroyi TaxID=184978 RepID=A0A6A5KIZ6_9PLEO|nr:hypothetical protein BDW02DRAFT_567597 [Decorospora gaudefroyi]
MAPSRSRAPLLSLLAVASLLPHSVWGFDCKDILADRTHFNFKELGGPHVVHWQEQDLAKELQWKYNFTVDLCDSLKWHKGGSLATECHHGARVCGIRENIDLSSDKNSTITPIDIAGTFQTQNGRNIDARFELLSRSKSHSDAGREGVRATLNGGRFPFDKKKEGTNQRAIIEFVCDKERTGLEGDEKDVRPHEDGDKEEKKGDDKKEEKLRAREENSNGKCEDTDASLRFCGYQEEIEDKDKKVRTLRLEWRTKYACEDAPAVDGGSHWGFFGWFFIIVFLAIAAYLIFGSWLNYNRYGARGWDLLPHGDTIRDIPYIAKDFARKVVGSVQGGGSRGGYAAV